MPETQWFWTGNQLGEGAELTDGIQSPVRKNKMEKETGEVLCKCGHRESEHEHGRCRGAKLMQRHTDAETGEEKKTPDMVEGLAPQCDCREFTSASSQW
jgi:hypothetical protein